ncbi:hypothetical protein [uncultured Parasphingopyxis sp.]|uniref:hypothetical protein n=1 Tax=uncultured Parasphingopyxis sp. TaxID=1547918 RepID=UPI0026195343|nr:hypothetical protein [uncultured Parasphingopyxis sp.]
MAEKPEFKSMPPEGREFDERDGPKIAEAVRRHRKRPVVLDAIMERSSSTSRHAVRSPYSDDDTWWAMLADAFGTNSSQTAHVFLDQLQALCREFWDEEEGKLVPNSDQLSFAITFIQSIKPRNPMEAALAAQMVAVHFATIPNAEWAIRGAERNAATLARLSKTYAIQMDTLRKMRSKGRKSKQTIKVVQEKHVHHHQHVHIEGEGQDFGGQSHAQRSEERMPKLDGSGPRLASVRSENAQGDGLPIPGDEGAAAMPDARREKHGRAEG